MRTTDVLIIGGGILGSSLAWHLAQLKAGTITVVDLDLAGTFSSSELNAGGCRATWWHPLNAEISWKSIQFYKTIASEVQFFQKGYLFLYKPSSWKIAQAKAEQYRHLQIPVHYLGLDEIRRRIPEFKNLKGVAGGTFSPEDGLIDPHLLKEYYRHQAKVLGVHFIDHAFVQSIESKNSIIQSVETAIHTGTHPLSEDEIKKILCTGQVSHPKDWALETFQPQVLANCSGAWLPVTSRQYGPPLPIQAVRRQISIFTSHDEDFSGRGMLVDSSGLYMHPEGEHSGMILAGYSNRDERPGYRFDYDGEKFFDRKIWLRLYRRGGRKHFAAIHHLRGWAGLYAVSPDRTGILGRAAGWQNLFELGAATGRGVMQSYTLGRAMAELIRLGRFESFDASQMTAERFQTGRILNEDLDI